MFTPLSFTEVHASSAETADGVSGAFRCSNSSILELWIFASAFSGFSAVDFYLETIPDALDETDDDQWTQAAKVTLTAAGLASASVARASVPLGQKYRLNWDATGTGSVTFRGLVGSFEGR